MKIKSYEIIIFEIDKLLISNIFYFKLSHHIYCSLSLLTRIFAEKKLLFSVVFTFLFTFLHCNKMPMRYTAIYHGCKNDNF